MLGLILLVQLPFLKLNFLQRREVPFLFYLKSTKMKVGYIIIMWNQKTLYQNLTNDFYI